jgi:hypothetical protein
MLGMILLSQVLVFCNIKFFVIFYFKERGSQGKSIIDGFGAWWMWRSIFISQVVSGRSKFQMCISWVFTKVFGRDFTRYE